jgi:hypothetical protein
MIFLTCFAGQGVLSNDSTVWLDRARAPQAVFPNIKKLKLMNRTSTTYNLVAKIFADVNSQIVFLQGIVMLYDNKYSLIIDVYFYATLSTQTSSDCAPKTFLDTLSDILDKC